MARQLSIGPSCSFFLIPTPCLQQNYLLGRKETCEMAERNKEALLEVSLFSPPAQRCLLKFIVAQETNGKF